MALLIKNGRVLNPDPEMRMDAVSDLLVENGVIVKAEPDIQVEGAQVLDASGCFVMPGFIDLHVHLRDPGLERKETVVTGVAAAARGGFTTIVAMPNTRPVVDNADIVNYVHNKAKSEEKTNVLQAGAITKGMAGKELSDIANMVRAGSPAISEDGKSVMDSYLLKRAMLIAKELDIPVLSHCEDISLVHGGVVNDDANAKKRDLPGISNAVEDIIAIRDVMLAKETGARLHLCHCSTSGSVSIVKMAKEMGISVTAEVCPHHFTLTSDDMPKDDTNYKMNPPLRTREDVEALRQGLRDGVMDVISTDHAPHTKEEKNDSMLRAPFGIVGLETAAALTYTQLVLGGYLTPMQMAEKMSYNPAQVIRCGKGSLSPKSAADIVVFDPNKVYTIKADEFASKGRNTPFDGWEVTGAVRATVAGGRVIYQER